MGDSLRENQTELEITEAMARANEESADPGLWKAAGVEANSGMKAVADHERRQAEERALQREYSDTIASSLMGLLPGAHQLDALAPAVGVNASFVALLQGDDGEYRDIDEAMEVLVAWETIDILEADAKVLGAIAEAAIASAELAQAYRTRAESMREGGQAMIFAAEQQKGKGWRKQRGKGKDLIKAADDVVEVSSAIHFMHQRMALWTGQKVIDDPHAKPKEALSQKDIDAGEEMKNNFIAKFGIGFRTGTDAVNFVFAELDKDHNGYIDGGEFVEFLHRIEHWAASVPFSGGMGVGKISGQVGRDDGKIWPWDVLRLLTEIGLG